MIAHDSFIFIDVSKENARRANAGGLFISVTSFASSRPLPFPWPVAWEFQFQQRG